MDNDLVSASEQRFSRGMPKPDSRAGDEDTTFLVGFRRSRGRGLFLGRIGGGLRETCCGCEKGPRDDPETDLCSCDKEPSTIHRRAGNWGDVDEFHSGFTSSDAEWTTKS